MSSHIPRLLETFWPVDRRPESQRRQRADARRAHQSSADRFVPDDDEHLLGQPGELAQHRGEDLEQRIDHHRQALLSSDKFAGANNEVLARGSSKFQAGLSKDGSNDILDRPHLVEDRAARNQQRTPGATCRRLHMNRLEPAGSHDLGDGARVIAVGLVRHRAHRGLRVSRLDADRRPPSGSQLAMQPSRQRTGFQSYAFEGQIEAGKESMERIRFAGCANLLDHLTGLINNANRGLFQRHVHSRKVLHGCSFSMFVAIRHRPRSHILTGAAAFVVSWPRPQSPHLSESIRGAAARYIEADNLESILIAIGIDEAMAADASGINAACDGFLEVINEAEGEANTFTAIAAMVDIRRAGIPMSAMAISRVAQSHARAVAAQLS